MPDVQAVQRLRGQVVDAKLGTVNRFNSVADVWEAFQNEVG